MCPTIQSAARNPFQFFSAQFAVISETVKWLGVPIYITNNRHGRERREKFDLSWYVDEIDVKISGRGIIFLKLSIIMGI